VALVYKDAKNLLAEYAGRGGRCSTSDIDLFIREVFEYLLLSSGANQDLRKFTFISQEGTITVPYEIESIQKVQVNKRVGQVWDKWFDFRSSSQFVGDCLPPSDALYEQPGYYPTVYSISPGGARVCTLGTCEESEDAHIIIEGKDITGRDVYTQHKGVQISGEYLSIKKGVRMFSQVHVGEITGVKKSPTNGYVQLLTNTNQFLSDYSPLEEVPLYRRYRLTSQYNSGCSEVSVLARIRLKEKYADNDRIPFETILTLRMAGQRVNAERNNDLQTAAAKDSAVGAMIEKESAYKRVQNGAPIEFLNATSAGLIRNAQVSSDMFGSRRRR